MQAAFVHVPDDLLTIKAEGKVQDGLVRLLLCCVQASGPPPQPDCGSVLPQLAGLLLQASSWFQPAHFAAAAAAMAACGVADEEFWDGLVAASEYKVGACSFGQLAEMLLALATVG